jgi:hypothetical protein
MLDGENPFFPLIPSENGDSFGNFFYEVAFNELEKIRIFIRITPYVTLSAICFAYMCSRA